MDDEGNIIEQHEVTPVRQVISEETSAIVRQCLEYVVASGAGKNGQVVGYRIGGKTGTADKTGTGDVVVSFMCFAPADDPQYIMLLTMDTPSRNTGVYVSGGNMVAPTASQIMSEILPHLGIEPDYSAEELVGADAAVPNVVGMSAADAKAKMDSAGFSYRTVGNGDTVTDQTPAGGAIGAQQRHHCALPGRGKTRYPLYGPQCSGQDCFGGQPHVDQCGADYEGGGCDQFLFGNVYAISQSQAAGTQLGCR